MEKKDDVLWQEEKSAPWREKSSRACFHWKSEGGSPHCQICKNMPYSRPCGEAQRLLPKPAEGPRAWSRWQMRLDQPQIAADWMAQALDVPVRKADRGGSVHLPLAPKVVQSQGRTYDTPTDTWEEEERINGVLGFGRKPRWAHIRLEVTYGTPRGQGAGCPRRTVALPPARAARRQS